MESEANRAGLNLKARESGGEWDWSRLADEKPTESLTPGPWYIFEDLPITSWQFFSKNELEWRILRSCTLLYIQEQLKRPFSAFPWLLSDTADRTENQKVMSYIIRLVYTALGQVLDDLSRSYGLSLRLNDLERMLIYVFGLLHGFLTFILPFFRLREGFTL